MLDNLVAAVRRAAPAKGTGTLLFSGGIDSSLLAWIAQREAVPLELLTIALPGGPDAELARRSASAMGLSTVVAPLMEEDVRAAAVRLREDHPGLTLTDLSVQTAMALALHRAPTQVVWCGQGADELFVGYAHSRALQGEALVARCEADLRKLDRVDLPISEELARRAGKVLRSPYLDPGFVEAVGRISWTDRSRGGESKPLLREMARSAGLPSEIVERPKKAFQYGSGIHRLLRKTATDERSVARG